MNQRLPYLDSLRAGAAICVLVSHLRSFLFVDWPYVTNKNILLGAFYFLTGLGHEAVVVFFVLSGFFVGGRALGHGIEERTFSRLHRHIA